MKIIGLNSGEINSSAVLLNEGNIISGAPEERFTRSKKTKVFPKNAMKFILDSNQLQLTDIDYVSQAWNPGASWQKYNPMISSNRTKREDYFYSIPDHLFNFVERSPKDWVKMEFGGKIPPVYFIQHHRCHAANAFFLSTFEEAAFLTADWRGEYECLTRGIGKENELTILDSQEVPHSLGMFYATFTELLGYQSDNDEWKVMALSAFQVDCSKYTKLIRSTVNLLPRGRFELDQSYYKGALLDQPNLYTGKLLDLLGGKKGKGSAETDDWMIMIAKAMQEVAEEIAVHVLDDLYERTKTENVVLAGGFFMNSVFNGKIADRTKFKNVFISYAPDDVGNSLGAALYVNHCILNQPRQKVFRPSAIGPSFNTNSIKEALNRRNIKYRILDNPPQEVANLISQGYVIGLLQGRMEFGDRALGNRSILGDPRNVKMKDKVNGMIKYREGYRPFAPATISEESHNIFEVNSGFECHYMEKVVKIREKFRELLPAVTHYDGSGRIQTVREEDNPYFYQVIKEFQKITGLPVVLNTSFNINAEPVVLSPDDAISTFYNSGLEFLVLENILVSKN